MDAGSIDTPAKLLKLELGSQIPIKSPFKLKRDILKAVQKNGWGKNSPGLLNNCSYYWMNKTSGVVVNEYCDIGPIEFALPNSKTGFFDEFVIQKIYGKNPDDGSDRFVLNDLDEPYGNIHSYVGCMMQSSGELVTFSVGGPRFFDNNTIVKCFNEWALGTARDEYEVDIYRDCERVYGSPLFRSHYERPTNPRGLEEALLNDWHSNIHDDDRHSDPFQDANEYCYVATQLFAFTKIEWI